MNGWRIEKIKQVSTARNILFRVGLLAFGLLFAGIVLLLLGHSPLAMAIEAITYTLGSSFGLQDLGTLITPLILTGLAAMIAMRVNLWNIGGEGQFYMGAWAAAGVGIFMPGPSYLVLPLMFIAGGLAGALWIAIPAYAKAKADVDEIITTLLMNFVALLWVGYFASGPWSDPTEAISASSLKIEHALPEWFGIWNIGIFFVLAIVLASWVLFAKTIWGYETSYVGANPESARYAGMPSKNRIMVTMLLSGMVAGIAGVVEVSGTVSRLQVGISSDFGYLGIIIAALAMGSHFGVLIAAGLIAILLNAGIVLETQGLSLNAIVALTGWLFLLAGISPVLASHRLMRVASPQVRSKR